LTQTYVRIIIISEHTFFIILKIYMLIAAKYQSSQAGKCDEFKIRKNKKNWNNGIGIDG
jgi:hypothetical protein